MNQGSNNSHVFCIVKVDKSIVRSEANNILFYSTCLTCYFSSCFDFLEAFSVKSEVVKILIVTSKEYTPFRYKRCGVNNIIGFKFPC